VNSTDLSLIDYNSKTIVVLKFLYRIFYFTLSSEYAVKLLVDGCETCCTYESK